MKGSVGPFAKIWPNLSANRTQKDARDPAKVMPDLAANFWCSEFW